MIGERDTTYNEKHRALMDKRLKAVIALGKIDESLEDLEKEKILPDLRKKYTNTYWKYWNRHCDDIWPMYIHLLEVFDTRTGIMTHFETDGNDDIAVKIKKMENLSLCEIAISKKEYDAAKTRFMNRLADL